MELSLQTRSGTARRSAWHEGKRGLKGPSLINLDPVVNDTLKSVGSPMRITLSLFVYVCVFTCLFPTYLDVLLSKWWAVSLVILGMYNLMYV